MSRSSRGDSTTTTPAGTPAPSTTVTVRPFTVRVVVPAPLVTTRSAASSSSTMVPVPTAAPEARVAFTGLCSRTATVSSASIAASPMTATSIVCLVVLGAKVSRPGTMAV